MGLANNCVISLVLAAVVGSVVGISCFQCNSYEHPECVDVKANETSSPFYQKCTNNEHSTMFCRKIVQKIKDQPKFLRVIRTCGFIEATNISNCQFVDSDFRTEMSCECFSDGCNGAKNATPFLASLILVIIALVL